MTTDIDPSTLTTEQSLALDAWVEAFAYNSRTCATSAQVTILGWLRDGRQTQVRNLVTLEFEPYTIHYTWRDRHFCPGYYDCTRCAA